MSSLLSSIARKYSRRRISDPRSHAVCVVLLIDRTKLDPAHAGLPGILTRQTASYAIALTRPAQTLHSCAFPKARGSGLHR